jgi:hypothetical protein
MKNYIKCGSRILFNYVVTLVFFLLFIYPFMSITGDKFNNWIPAYCLLWFVFIAFLTYTDMNELAKKEKKPQYELDPRPWKGLVMGLIGFFPVALTVTVLSLVHFDTEFAERLKHLVINGLLGPVYFVARIGKESVIGYIAAILLIPAIAALGYLMGYFGIDIFKRFRKKEQVQEKPFKKSPWNPSVNEGKTVKKKKKKTTGGQ